MDNGRVPRLPLSAMRDQLRGELFGEFLPFMDRHVVDHEVGGFLCHADRDGARLSTRKHAWFDGRGLWVYAFLYNHFSGDPAHLEVARKTADFVLKRMPDDDAFWPATTARDGSPLEFPNAPNYGRPSIYGDLFIATGLAEYSRIEGRGACWDLAKRILLKCLAIYDTRPGYGSLPAADGAPAVDAPRILGHWMILLRLATDLLTSRADPEVEAVALRCRTAVMEHHADPETGLLHEYLNHDLSRIGSGYGEILLGHGPEVLWMVMDEALRINDQGLFARAAASFRRHLEVFWDDVYGGLLEGFADVSRHIGKTRKWLWLQQEALNGLIRVIEHTGAPWAADWYGRIHAYVHDRFLLKPHGLPLWIFLADRKVTFERHSDRIEHFHLPRYLMVNLLAIDRLLGRRRPAGTRAGPDAINVSKPDPVQPRDPGDPYGGATSGREA